MARLINSSKAELRLRGDSFIVRLGPLSLTGYGVGAEGQVPDRVVLPVDYFVRVLTDGTLFEIRRAKPRPQEFGDRVISRRR